MAHHHISDIELMMFCTDATSLHPERVAAIEAATAECVECQTSLEFLTIFKGDGDADAPIDSAPADDGDEIARMNFERILAEDREAELLFADEGLLSVPARAAWRRIERQRRFQSGGVVRLLARTANRICEQHPLDALTFADAAIAIAESLPDNSYPWNSIFELRGSVWKERANALLVLGRYPAALDALASAERAFRELRSQGFGLSTTALIRASVLYEQELFVDAMAWGRTR